MPRNEHDPVLRLFISSPFLDFKAEREALHEKVFPKLKRRAAKRGLEFRVIDLRWGITDEAAREQRTVPLCLEQVRLCLRSPLRPSFLFLLGDRYGWCPLPSTLTKRERKYIEVYLERKGRKEDLLVLNKLYRLDENAVPPVYEIQPFDCVLPPQTDSTEFESHFRDLIIAALSPRKLPRRRRTIFGSSITEQEIETAVKASSDRVLGVFRTIRGLPKKGMGTGYADDPNHCDVDHAQNRLHNLRHRIRNAGPR